MVVTNYSIHNTGLHLRVALVADLHDNDYTRLIPKIRAASPDIIAIPGDLMDSNQDYVTVPEEQEHALAFLREAVKIAPTFYSLGNNERVVDVHSEPVDYSAVRDTGAFLLDNDYVEWNDIWIGGLTSAVSYFHWHPGLRLPPNIPNTDWITEFDSLPGFKVLLSHHPEYYPDFLRQTGIDLILSGHAHGGQIRLFGRGLLAPNQGLFPEWTSGVHDNRLVISRGLANTVKIPRLFNPKELVIIDVD